MDIEKDISEKKMQDIDDHYISIMDDIKQSKMSASEIKKPNNKESEVNEETELDSEKDINDNETIGNKYFYILSHIYIYVYIYIYMYLFNSFNLILFFIKRSNSQRNF